MTLDQLDKHIKNYITYLKATKSLRNVGAITFKIKHSKKSKSIYVRLMVIVNDKPFTKTLRFSDHAYTPKRTAIKGYKGVIVEPNKEISKRTKKCIEAVLRKEITNLVYGAGIATVCKFRADGQ